MAGSNKCDVEIEERVLKKFKLIAEWEDEGLFKPWQEKMRLQDETLTHILHISDAKMTQKGKQNSTGGQ